MFQKDDLIPNYVVNMFKMQNGAQNYGPKWPPKYILMCKIGLH